MVGFRECLTKIAIMLIITMVGCTKMQLRYEALIDVHTKPENELDQQGTNAKKHVLYEKSYDTTYSAGFCILTAIFYGGTCWSYFLMPSAADEKEMEVVAQNKIRKIHPEFKLYDSEVFIRRWADRPESFSLLSSDSKSSLTPELEPEETSCQKPSKMGPKNYDLSINEYYLGGALAGTYLGFGLGHFIQGRYRQGFLYTAIDLVSLFFYSKGAFNCESLSGCEGSMYLATFYIITRFAQTVDLWLPKSKRAESSGIEPFFSYDGVEVALGVGHSF